MTWSFGEVNDTYMDTQGLYFFTNNGFTGGVQEEVLTLEPDQLSLMVDIPTINCSVADVYTGTTEVEIIELGMEGES